MSIEAGVVVGPEGRPLYWHMPKGASVVSLPDSRDLWDAIWEHRKILRGFAHTHPGFGKPSPSETDLTTFVAVEAALGRRLIWWILTQDKMIALEWSNQAQAYVEISEVGPEVWMGSLREVSRTSEEKDALARRYRVENIRATLLELPADERIQALSETHVCLRCGEDLRTTPYERYSPDEPKKKSCTCTRDE